MSKNNLSPLAFYDSIEEQSRFKSYAYGEVYDLITPLNRVLPFQCVMKAGDILHSVIILNIAGEEIGELNGSMSDVVKIESVGEFKVLRYEGLNMTAFNNSEGQHYIRVEYYDIEENQRFKYSEIFTFRADVSDCLLLEYGDAENLEYNGGVINYADSFRFRVYLPTQVSRPEYAYSEEVETRDGITFVGKQISEKTYKFEFLAPEYLCDALRVPRLCDYVTIQSEKDTFEVNTILFTPKWANGGFLASVDAEFQCDTVLKKIGRGAEINAGGDFSYTDFNDDFNN